MNKGKAKGFNRHIKQFSLFLAQKQGFGSICMLIKPDVTHYIECIED